MLKPEKNSVQVEFLDQILQTLLNSVEHRLSFKEINVEVYKTLSTAESKRYGSQLVMVIDSTNFLGNALLYLNKNGDIEINFSNELIFISYQGIVKLSTGGYQQEVKRKNRADNLYNFYLFSMVIFGLAALVMSILAYCKNCPCISLPK